MSDLERAAALHIKQEPGESWEQLSRPSSLSYFNHGIRSGWRSAWGRSGACMCEVCQCEFADGRTLQRHKLCHFNSCRVCYACDLYFAEASILTLHVSTVHSDLALRGTGGTDECFCCPVCLQRFWAKRSLLFHQQLHRTEDLSGQYGCRVCGLDFAGPRALVSHLASARHAEMKVRIQSIFVCIDCRSVFVSRDSYAFHMMLRAQNDTCRSSLASAVFSADGRSSAFRLEPAIPVNLSCGRVARHMDKHAMDEHTISDTNTPVVRSTSVEADKQNHQTKEVEQEKFHCLKCNKACASQDAFTVHVMNHIHESSDSSSVLKQPEERPRLLSAPLSHSISGGYLCEICQSRHDCKDSLAMHVMTCHATTDAPINRSTIVKQTSTLFPTGNLKRPLSAPLSQFEDGQARNKVARISPLTTFGFLSRSRLYPQQIPRNNNIGIYSSETSWLRSKKRLESEFITEKSPAISPEPSGQSVSNESVEKNESPIHCESSSVNALLRMLDSEQQLLGCPHCKIFFLDRTVYFLHMGLHNLNNPWQCNLCGKVCSGLQDFSAHVIHY